MEIKLKVGSQEVDLAPAFPLTLGDWKKLEKIGVMEKGGSMKIDGADDMQKVLSFLFEKLNHTFTVDDLDTISLPDLGRVSAGIQKMMQAEQDALDPNS